MYLCDTCPHGFDNAPSAADGAECKRGITGQDHPVVKLEFLVDAAGEKDKCDDAHCFLGVVGAMSDAVAGGGHQLKLFE